MLGGMVRIEDRDIAMRVCLKILVIILCTFGIAQAQELDCNNQYLQTLQDSGIAGMGRYFGTTEMSDQLSSLSSIAGDIWGLSAGIGEVWHGLFMRQSVQISMPASYRYIGYDFHGESEKLGHVKLHLAQKDSHGCLLVALYVSYQP